MTSQVRVDSSAIAERLPEGAVQEILPDLAYRRLAIVNVIFAGLEDSWVLIDAGVLGSAGFIRSAAESRYGPGARPSGIMLTHGHFDHVGALGELIAAWDVPIYAHELELPYLSGKAAYPPPDPSVGGGLMSLASPLYPRGPVNAGPSLSALPSDGSVPFLPGWRCLPTPGHSPGHVSFWRESDRTLIAGDAVITTRQESAYAVLMQEPELHGPPMYYTPDWESARESVRTLASLQPQLLVTGHGQPLEGQEMREGLRRLADDFDSIAIPKHGVYLEKPAKPEDGSAYWKP
jgi:glyoxylase-like metal-dependent hydrolase (beta-lactamase superfamily II)